MMMFFANPFLLVFELLFSDSLPGLGRPAMCHVTMLLLIHTILIVFVVFTSVAQPVHSSAHSLSCLLAVDQHAP